MLGKRLARNLRSPAHLLAGAGVVAGSEVVRTFAIRPRSTTRRDSSDLIVTRSSIVAVLPSPVGPAMCTTFADDAAGGDDLVAALEVAQPFLVVLPLLLLRPDHHEVEDREDRDDLENEGKQRRASARRELHQQRERES